MPGPPDPPQTLTGRLAFLLQLALARARAMGEQALSELGTSGREYGVLAVLATTSLSVQHRTGAAPGIDRTTTTALLAGLEDRGLVRRSRDPSNRHAYPITLTDAGEHVRARAAQMLADCDDRFLDPLPADQRGWLRQTLRLLL